MDLLSGGELGGGGGAIRSGGCAGSMEVEGVESWGVESWNVLSVGRRVGGFVGSRWSTGMN